MQTFSARRNPTGPAFFLEESNDWRDGTKVGDEHGRRTQQSHLAKNVRYFVINIEG
jgi:hypothetical protein